MLDDRKGIHSIKTRGLLIRIAHRSLPTRFSRNLQPQDEVHSLSILATAVVTVSSAAVGNPTSAPITSALANSSSWDGDELSTHFTLRVSGPGTEYDGATIFVNPLCESHTRSFAP